MYTRSVNKNLDSTIYYNRNEIRSAILNNPHLDSTLHVIAVVSNPFNFKNRLRLSRDFLKRMDSEYGVTMYIVELIYPGLNECFQLASDKNPRHLQLKVDKPLWHKENMINLGVQKLLPKNWKAMAWIDADIEFESPYWAKNTLKVLNGCRDVIQLFSHAIDMDSNKDAMNIFSSFGFMYEKEREYTRTGILKLFHPGYAWACTRNAYNKMGGLIDFAILGSGDQHIAMSLVGIGKSSANSNVNSEYMNKILEFEKRCKNLRLGYIPGVIRHHYHGSKSNRKYVERWSILVKYNFNPLTHITINKDGVIIPTESCPKELLDDIMEYFRERKEDD
jgi:hypothetical protein